MKRLTTLLLLFILTILIWGLFGFWRFNKETYISEKVLAKTKPFSVKLDIDLLKSLKPAYE